MFTKEMYRQYFVEIHHKQKNMIALLRDGLSKISEDRMQKALTWHMRREIRLAVLVQKHIRSLSSGPHVEKNQAPQSHQALPEEISL